MDEARTLSPAFRGGLIEAILGVVRLSFLRDFPPRFAGASLKPDALAIEHGPGETFPRVSRGPH